jgi:hypothetical protein
MHSIKDANNREGASHLLILRVNVLQDVGGSGKSVDWP